MKSSKILLDFFMKKSSLIGNSYYTEMKISFYFTMIQKNRLSCQSIHIIHDLHKNFYSVLKKMQ